MLLSKRNNHFQRTSTNIGTFLVKLKMTEEKNKFDFYFYTKQNLISVHIHKQEKKLIIIKVLYFLF